MARPANTGLREAIFDQRMELMLGNPLMPKADINAAIAKQHNISVSTVRYYLRTRVEADTRIRYSDADRQTLVAMSRKELKAYAAKHGKNFGTLYAMVWRHKARSSVNATKLQHIAAIAEGRGYMDFSRLSDLKAFSIPRNAFKDARKVIQGVQNLDLVPPNYIIHRETCKFYRLSLSEQKMLLQNPRWFLKATAAHISRNWSKYHPTGYYFTLLDPRMSGPVFLGQVITTHDSFEAAAAAQKRYIAENPLIVPQIIETHGDSRSPYVRYSPGELYKRPDLVVGKVRSVIRGDQDISEDNLEPEEEPNDPWTCGVDEDESVE